MRTIPIDDALEEAEATWDARNLNAVPYSDPVIADLSEPKHECWVAGCGRAFESKARLNGHLIDDHGGR